MMEQMRYLRMTKELLQQEEHLSAWLSKSQSLPTVMAALSQVLYYRQKQLEPRLQNEQPQSNRERLAAQAAAEALQEIHVWIKEFPTVNRDVEEFLDHIHLFLPSR